MAQIAALLKVSRATLYHHLDLSAHAAEKAA
jgi:hypothetical protein